jgi:AhpD family alkylhydroperoxidase
MQLDKGTRRLIAVGASISANCQPCLQTNAAKALEEGITEQELAEAIEIGKMVRQGAASKMDKFTLSLRNTVSDPANGMDDGCGCSAS